VREVLPPEHPYPRTDAQFEEYIRGNYFPRVDGDEFREVVDQYPSGVFYALSMVPKNTEMRCTRRESGVSLWHGNSQRVDTTIQADRVYPGRHHIPWSQKVFPRTSSARTKCLVLRYSSLPLLIHSTVSHSYSSEQHLEIHARSRFCTQQFSPISLSARITDSRGPRRTSRTCSIFTVGVLWRRPSSISSTTLTLTENLGTGGQDIP